MSRRRGRILAFQALYSYDVGGLTLDRVMELEWDKKDFRSDASGGPGLGVGSSAGGVSGNADGQSFSSDETKDYARLLIAGTVNHLAQIDHEIENHLSEKWEMARLNKVSLAILRLSVFELMFQPDLASSIVIDEAIRIAKEYGEEDSYRFINAILDRIRRDVKSDGLHN